MEFDQRRQLALDCNGITEITLGLMEISSLESLYKLDLGKLKKLEISGTEISREEAFEFKKKNPGCYVEFDGEVL